MSSTRDLSRNRSMSGFGGSFSGMNFDGGEDGEEVELVDCSDAQTDPHEHALCHAGVSFGLGFKAPSRAPGEWDKEIPEDENNNKSGSGGGDDGGENKDSEAAAADVDNGNDEEGAGAGNKASSPSSAKKGSMKKNKSMTKKGSVQEEQLSAEAAAAPPPSTSEARAGGGGGAMAAVQEEEESNSEKREPWRPVGRKGQVPPPRVVESGTLPGAHMPLKLREQMSSFPQTIRIPSLVSIAKK